MFFTNEGFYNPDATQIFLNNCVESVISLENPLENFMGFFENFLDFNHNGKLDFSEKALGFAMFMECMKKDEKSREEAESEDMEEE